MIAAIIDFTWRCRGRRLLGAVLSAAAVFLAAGCILPAVKTVREPVTLPENVWVVNMAPLTADQQARLAQLDSLLIMIPGVSSGNIAQTCTFLDRVRRQSGHELAVFYDWEPGNLGRKLVAPMATEPAAARLIGLCDITRGGREARPHIDLLAHSAGTVVVNKAAIAIVEAGVTARFRHVLLLGTALDASEPLNELKAVSATILNVHSAFDKINRNISEDLGFLAALGTSRYRNLRTDYSLSGRIMRHYVFLSSNPENWFQYGEFLGKGVWPEAALLRTDAPPLPADLCRMARWVIAHPDVPCEDVRQTVPELLNDPDLQVKYYAVILAGLLTMKPQAPALQAMLDKEGMPVYIRKEIYQALGNLKDGHYVDFLREARDRDPECAEEIRDVVRALKRQRIAPIRE